MNMSNYYVSGCIGDGDSISTCDDSEAQFWTLYHRNNDGLSTAIIDCMFRKDAEAAMRVYEQRDALAAAKALTAQPIKLPQRYVCEGYHIDEAYLAADEDGDCFDREEVIEAIRAAGYEVIG